MLYVLYVRYEVRYVDCIVHYDGSVRCMKSFPTWNSRTLIRCDENVGFPFDLGSYNKHWAPLLRLLSLICKCIMMWCIMYFSCPRMIGHFLPIELTTIQETRENLLPLHDNSRIEHESMKIYNLPKPFLISGLFKVFSQPLLSGIYLFITWLACAHELGSNNRQIVKKRKRKCAFFFRQKGNHDTW